MYPDELRRIKKVMEQAFPEDHFLLKDLSVIEDLILDAGGVKPTPASELFDQVSQFSDFSELRDAIEKEKLSPTIVAFLYIKEDGDVVLLAYKPKTHKPLAIITLFDSSDWQDDPNRERLLCLLRAINEVKNAKTAMTLYVNNEILAKGSMVWCKNWEKNGWLTAKGTPVMNQDLWQSINTARAGMARCTIRDIGEATDKTKQVYADFVKEIEQWDQ